MVKVTGKLAGATVGAEFRLNDKASWYLHDDPQGKTFIMQFIVLPKMATK
jgi:hypothetical protein